MNEKKYRIVWSSGDDYTEDFVTATTMECDRFGVSFIIENRTHLMIDWAELPSLCVLDF